MGIPALRNLRCVLITCGLLLAVVACSGQPPATLQPTQISLTEIPDLQIIPSLEPSPGGEILTPTPTPEVTPPPSPTPKPHPSAFVIVWDAGQRDAVYQAMSAGRLPHFKELASQGLRAEYALSVDPSLSAPAQTSLVTGTYPNRTGIVSNAFHNASDDFYWYRLGFDEPFYRAEPAWVTASRNGLKTAALFVAGARPDIPGQAADYTIGYGVRDAYSRQVNISLVESAGWENMPLTYSPALEGSFHIPEVARVDMLIVDTSDDGQIDYDRVLINSRAAGDENNVNENTLTLEVGEWGSMILLPNITAGADFLIQEITPQKIRLYYTGVYHNMASPRTLLENINERFGYFPAGPDAYALDHGWITEDDYLEMLEHSARWMAEVSAWVYTTYQPDLLFTWQDGFDSVSHNFLLVDSRQTGFSPERVEQYRSYLERAQAIADQALESMLEAVNLQKTSVFLTADHGIAPVHTNVYVNTILEKAGLLKLDSKNYVDVKRSKALAVTSGGAVNIYINLEGVEKDGILPLEEYATVQSQIVGLLSQLVDPNTGEAVFQHVFTHQDLEGVNLNQTNSGDIFAQAYPGYNLDDWRGNNSVFEPSTIYGDHGYDSTLPEMYTLFIAAGGQIPNTGKTIPAVKIVDLVPTLATLLGFEPADDVAGRPIAEIFLP